MSVKNIVILLITFMTLIIIIQNLEIVKLNFLFWTIQINLLLIILLSFVSGLIVGWLTRMTYNKRKISEIKTEK
jgi:uncharacterized integral membrane protein